MDTDVFNQAEYCINKIKENKKPDLEEELKTGSLSTVPLELKFIFDFGNFKTQEKIIEVTNYFSKPCPIRFLPLETHYFKIKNICQKRWLNPGSLLKINILFMPDENRNYNDVLQIRYFDNRLMQIKIFAKLTTKFTFPTTVNFGDVPLGRVAYYKIPIHSHAEKEFSFAILPSKGDSCVDIYPRWGRLKPKQKPVTIMIIYRPLRYISMNFQIRIFISDLCKAPHVINFYAYTRPGLLRETLENVKAEMKSDTQQKEVGAPLRKEIKPISVEKEKSKSCSKVSAAKFTSFKSMLLKYCGRIPLYTLHAVNCILISKVQRSFSEYELKGPLGVFLFKTLEQRAQEVKKFLTKVENYHQENEQAKFHHKPKVNYGTSDTNGDQTIEIKIQREQAWDDYENLITHTEKDIFERKQIEKIRQRILRNSEKYPNVVSPSSSEEEPFFHYCKTFSFLQAARKIVLKNRLLKILTELQKLTPESIEHFEETLILTHPFTMQV